MNQQNMRLEEVIEEELNCDGLKEDLESKDQDKRPEGEVA